METNTPSDAALIRERHADVVFAFYNEDKTEKKILKAQKHILANASDVFDTMFFGSLPEADNKEITIEDFSVEIFEILLDYIYSHKRESFKLNSLEVGMELLQVAKKYMLHELEELCERFLIQSLKSSTALELMEFSRVFELKNLQEVAFKIFSKATRKVIKAPSFKDIDIEILMELVKQDALETTELELFNAVESVAKHRGLIRGSRLDSSNNTSELQGNPAWERFREIVKQIRYLSLTHEQFSDGPSLSALLTWEEAFLINYCFIKPDKIDIYYPEGFIRNERKLLSVRRVFFDIKAKGDILGRLVIELRGDILPNAAKIFRERCIGKNDFGYKGSKFFNIGSGYCSARSVNLKTTHAEDSSVYYNENFLLKHTDIGIVSMERISDTQSYRNLFHLSFKPVPVWDNKYVVIGKVVEGFHALLKISSFQNNEVLIENCGALD